MTPQGTQGTPAAQPVRSIRAWREVRAYTLKELADLAGVKLQTLWYWEIGSAHPRPANRRALAHALGVNVEQIDWDAHAETQKRSRASVVGTDARPEDR